MLLLFIMSAQQVQRYEVQKNNKTAKTTHVKYNKSLYKLNSDIIVTDFMKELEMAAFIFAGVIVIG